MIDDEHSAQVHPARENQMNAKERPTTMSEHRDQEHLETGSADRRQPGGAERNATAVTTAESMVRWHRGHLTGVRILVTLAREDHVLGIEAAGRLHRDLGRALDEASNADCARP